MPRNRAWSVSGKLRSAPKSRRHNGPFRRRSRRPRPHRRQFERLEDRWLLAVTFQTDGDTLSFDSDAGDTLYLQVLDGGELRYSTDGNSYDPTGFHLSSDTTVTYDENQSAYLTGMAAGGGTFQMTGDVQVTGDLRTLGGDLTLAGSSITVGEGVLISTSPADGVSGSAGSLTLQATRGRVTDGTFLAAPTVTLNDNSRLQATGDAGDGAISLTADDTFEFIFNFTLANQIDDLFNHTFQAQIDVGQGVEIDGGDVTLTAKSGILNKFSSTPSTADKIGLGVLDFLSGVLDKTALSLPISAIVTDAQATTELHEGASIRSTGAVNVSSSATANSTGEATNFYLRKSNLGFFAFTFGKATTDAETLVDANAQVIAAGDVSISAHTKTTTSSTALENRNPIPDSTANPNAVGLAAGYNRLDTKAHATVSAGALIESSAGNVTVAAAATDSNTIAVQSNVFRAGIVSLSYAGAHVTSDVQATVDGTIIAGGRDTGRPVTVNPFQTESAVAAQGGGATLDAVDYASSRFSFAADPGYRRGEPLIYGSGLGGAIPGLENHATYYAIPSSDGTRFFVQLAATSQDALAGQAIQFGQYPTINGLPITNVDPSAASSILFDFDPGFTEGQTVTVTPAAGQFLGYRNEDGSLAGPLGGTYTAHVLNAVVDSENLYALQLRDAGGQTVQLDDSPYLTTASGVTLRIASFNTDSDSITLNTADVPAGFDGLQNGDALTYHAALATHVTGLRDGETYYAIVDPSQFADVSPDSVLSLQLAANAQDAASANPAIESPTLTWTDGGGQARTSTIAAAVPQLAEALFSGTHSFRILSSDPATGILTAALAGDSPPAGEPPLTDGELLLYLGAAGTSGTLQSGRLYVVQVIDQSDPAAIQLRLRDAVRLPMLGTLTESVGAGQEFAIQYVETNSDNLLTISLNSAGPLAPLNDGDTLIYGGSSIPGFLIDRQPYRVHVVQQTSPSLIQVQLTEAWFTTPSGNLLDPLGHTFAIRDDDPHAAKLSLTGPAGASLAVGQTLTYSGPDISAAGYLRDGGVYRVASASATGAASFDVELESANYQVATSGMLQGSGQAPSSDNDNFHPLGQSFDILNGDANTGILTIALRAESEFTTIADGQWLRFQGPENNGPDVLRNGQLYAAEVIDQSEQNAIRIRLRTAPQQVGYGTLIGPGGSYVIHHSEADGTLRLSPIDSARMLVDGDNVTFQGASGAGDTFLRDGQSYQVSVLDPDDPLDLRIRLGRYVAPTYGSLSGASGDYSIEDFHPDTEVVTLSATDAGAVASLMDGETLTYSGAAWADTSRLRNGQSYMARIVDQSDPTAIRVLLIDPTGPYVSSVSSDGIDPAGNALLIERDPSQPAIPDGAVVTFHEGSAGARIGGLLNGATYQAVVDDASPNFVRLLTVGDGQSIALSLEQTLTGNGRTYTITGSDGFLHAVSIAEEGAAPGVTSVAEGDALVYSAALGQTTGSLVDGQTYYVHLPDPANTSQIQLLASPQAGEPLNIHTNVRLGELDQAFLSGTAHTLAPVTQAGINITATLGSTDKLSVSAAVGKEPLFKQLKELGNIAATSVLNRLGGQASRNPAPEAPAAKDFSGLLSATGSVLVQIVDNSVAAEVGATAVLKSTAGIIVDAALTENNQVLNATTNTQRKPKDSAQGADSTGRKVDLAIAFVFNQLANTATASIDGGAQVDATGAIVVESDVIYPWAGQIHNPNKFVMGQFMKGLFTGTLGRSELVNNWSLAATRADQDPNNPLTLAGAVNYVDYTNQSTAMIGAGAWVNQDSAYRGPEQSVSVDARTTFQAVNYSGNTQFNLAPADVIKAGRDGGWRGAANTVFGGNDNGAAVGIGAALTYVSMHNTTEATVGGPGTRINFGESAATISQSFDAANAIDTDNYAIDLGWNPGFTTGMPVLYDAQGGDAVGGLTDGDTYYVIVDPANRNQIQLARSAAAALSNQPIQLKSGGSGTQTLSEQQPSGLNVTATQTVLNVNVGTSGALQSGASSGDGSLGLGAGGRYGGNGTVAVFVANTATLAQVAGGTRVHGNLGTAGTANVQALDTLQQIAVVGGAFKGQNLGVGLSGVWNDVTRNTRAVVGDNFDGSVGTPASSDWSIGGPLNVQASSSGDVISVALSAAVAAAPAAKQQPAGQAAANAPVQTTSWGVQVSGDGSYSHVNDVTQAYVNDSGTFSLGSLAATATDSTILAGFGGSFAIAALSNPQASTEDHTNVGLAGSYAEVNLDGATAAFVRSARLAVAGDLSVQAERDNYLGTLTATSAASGTYKSSWEVAGSVALGFFSGDTQAYLSGVEGDVGGDLTVTAADQTIYVAIGGGAGVGASTGIGVSFGYISIAHQIDAFASATQLNVGGDVDFTATGQADVGSLGLALGIAEGTSWGAGAGNASVNQITMTLDAHVTEQSSIVASGNTTIAAVDSSYLVSVSGAAALTRQGAVAIGAAVGYNLIDNTLLAYVDSSTVRAEGGSLTVSTSSRPTLISVAVGGADADNIAFGGSVTVNSITNTLASYVNDAVVGAGDDLNVTASEAAMLIAVAGAVALSGNSSLGGDAAVGAAVAYNYVGQSFDAGDPAFPNGSPAPQSSSQAYIQNSRASAAGDLRIAAGFQPSSPLPDVSQITIDGSTGFGFELDLDSAIEVDHQLVAVAVGGAGAASFTLGGALSMAYVRQTIQAYIAAGSEVSVGGGVTITAIDDSSIGTGAGGVAIAKNNAAGIGAGVAYNDVANHLLASIDNSALTSGGSLSVISQESGASTAVAVGGAQADSFALGGAVVVSVMDNSAESHIRNNSTVQAGSILLSSTDDSAIVAGAGQVTFANNGVSVGAAVTASNLSNTVTASIEDSAATAIKGGLDVLATSNLAITAGAAGIDVANAFTLGGSVVYNSLTTSTQALIDGATTQSDGVAVSAINSSAIDTGGGNVSLTLDGLGAMGAAIASNRIDNTVGAAIQAATVVSAGPIDVTAKSSESIVAVAVGISGSVTNERFSLSLLGSGAGNQVTSSTQAQISDGTTVSTSAAPSSTSPVRLTAADSSSITAGAGAAAFDFDLFQGGLTVAVGASAAVNRIEAQADQPLVSARIEGSTVNTSGDVDVTAEESSALTSWTVAGALDASRGKGANFGIAGAGAGSSNTLHGRVEGLIGDGAAVTAAGGDVMLGASNTSRSEAVAGGLAVAVSGGGDAGVTLSVGAALALNDLAIDTLAAIVGASVASDGRVDVTATDSSQLKAAAVGVGGAIAEGKAGAFAFGGAGSGVGNRLQNSTTARIADSKQDGTGTPSQVTSGGDLNVTATLSSSLIGAAGTLAFSIAASRGSEEEDLPISAAPAFGVSVVINEVSNSITADIMDSTVHSGGDLTLAAQAPPPDSDNSVRAVTIAGGVAPGESAGWSVTFAGAGAGSGNTVNNSLVASISDNSIVTADGDISLSAQDKTTIESNGGGFGLSISGGTTALAPTIGAAEAKNTVSNSTQATIDHSTVHAGGQLSVSVTSQPQLKALAFGVGVAAAVGDSAIAAAGSGAAAYNDVINTTTATIQNASSVTADATGDDAIVVSATDEPGYTAKADSGSLGFSFGAGVSVSLAVGVSLARNTVTQKKDDTDPDTIYPTAAASIGALSGTDSTRANATLGGVKISATSDQTAAAHSVAVAASLAVPLNPDEPVSIALAGSGASATNDVSNGVTAAVGSGVAIQATGVVAVMADQTPSLDADATGAAASLGVFDVAIAGSVSSSTVNGAISSYVGDDASLAAGGLNLQAAQRKNASNDATASASAVAGSGAILAGVDGAKSTASITGSVSASTGTNVALPDGDIIVSAVSDTLQSAETTGVTLGYIAAGGNDSTATSNVTTSSTLGDSPVMRPSRTGSLVVQATGSDRNAAWAIAGVGGVVAGNGASAHTDNSSTVTAGITGGSIHAGNVAVLASHTSDYAPAVNSINASIAGASGAEARNTDTTSTMVTIGDNTAITAAGTVTIAAGNQILQAANPNASDINKGASAYAGAGGVVGGDAAGNHVSTHGGATVTVGKSVSIHSGTNPFTNAGGISIVANGGIDAQDLVLLSTGGLIEGGGTASTIDATITNSVSVGIDAHFTTWGNLAAGAFGAVNARTSSQANTGGLAGTADAHATTKVLNNPSLSIGSGSTLHAFGNLSLTAGDDPTGLTSPTFLGDSNAEAYAYGGITIPSAASTATLTANAAVLIDTNTSIGSGRNVTISAFDGSPSGTQSSVSQWNGAGSPSNDPATVNASTSVTLRGDIVAGMFHELTLTIPDDASAGTFSRTLAVDSSGPADLPLESIVSDSSVFDDNFSAPAFIQSHFDPADASLLLSGVSSAATPVGAFTLGPLFASGGSVTVNGSLQTGSGTISAYFGPKILVRNDSPDYLVLGSIAIPNTAMGQVVINGQSVADNSSNQGITARLIAADPEDPTADVTIEQNFEGTVGDAPNGPALFVSGTISNLGGNVSISNQQGSIGQSATIFGQQVSITAPNGNVALTIPPPGVEYLGTNPYSNWQDTMIWPGGNPFKATSLNADAAVSFVANWWANGNFQSTEDLTLHLIGKWQSADTRDVTPGGNSTVFIGDSVPYDRQDSGGDDSLSTNSRLTGSASDGARNDAYQISYYPDDGETRGHFAYIPLQPLGTSASAWSSASLPPDSAPPAVQARSVSITAATIDLNGKIQTTGVPTDWSVLLPATLADSLLAYRQQFLAGVQRNPQYAIPLSDLSAVNPGDSRITATYDAARNQITVSEVSNISTGGVVSLRGAIISTNPNGEIDLQGGVGNVTVTNLTGIPLVVQNIDAGGAGAASQVRIIDTNQPASSNQTLYVFEPGQPIVVRNGPQDATIDQLTVTGSQSGTTVQYQPADGLRWQWEQIAKLKRQSHGTVNSPGWYLDDWQWENSSVQPWQYFHTASSHVFGFGGDGDGWTVNSQNISTSPLANDVLLLTDNQSAEARSAWFNTPVTIGDFTASFTYQASGDRSGDGVALVFQTAGLDALGGSGGGLGYAGIAGKSAAFEINIYHGHTIGTNFVENGATGVYLPTGSIDVAAGQPISVTLNYDATRHVLDESLRDSFGRQHVRTYSNIDLQSILGGSTAYLGFTGATGGSTSRQTISNFIFDSSNTTYYANPAGQLVLGQTGPVFQQSIQGEVLSNQIVHAQYDRHDASNNSFDWYFHYPTEVSLTLTASVKADNPIAINFGGVSSSAHVTIDSNSPVRLTGTIQGAHDTRISTDGDITASALSRVASRSLDLTAGGGIGGRIQPLIVTLGDGELNALGGQHGVYLTLNSGATIGTVIAGDEAQGFGDVVLNAVGSLTAALDGGDAPQVSGRNITISSTLGSVGSPVEPLAIQTHGVELANGGVRGGTITVQALGDVALTQGAGNLLIRNIVSDTGSVYLNVPGGSVYDAATSTSHAPTVAEAHEVWQRLGLNDPDFGQVGVAAFENSVVASYQQYWQLLHNGSVEAGAFTLKASAIGTFRPLAAAALGVSDPTDEQVRAYASGQYNGLVAFFDANLPLDWRNASEFQVFDPQFDYVATPEQAADLTLHTSWTTDQLLYALDRAALQAAADVPLQARSPHVTGNAVSITAGGEVGSVRPPLVISLAAIQSGMLTTAEKAALATARVAGEAVYVGTDSQGQAVTFPDGQVPSGVTATGVQLTIHRPLLVAVTNSPEAGLNVTAPGGITIWQMAGDLVIGAIDSDGAVELAATGSIVNAPQTVVSGFGGDGTGWTTNTAGSSSAVITGDVLTLTDNNTNQARSAWFNAPVPNVSFTASFTYQAGGDRAADGVALVWQNEGLRALGGGGGGLGLDGISGPSAAYQINLYDGHVRGTNFVLSHPPTTGVYIPTQPQIDLASGNPIRVTLLYDEQASAVVETLTDATTGATVTRTYTDVDLRALLGPASFVGFTGATGAAASTQTIRDFEISYSYGGIAAADIRLQSVSGSIGTADSPLLVTLEGGRFHAAAESDIYVEQTSGDLHVGQVTSVQGDVFLDPPQPSQSVILHGDSVVSAPLGHVTFQAHDDVSLAAGSRVHGLSVTVQAGFSLIPGSSADSRITLAGLIDAGSLLILGGSGKDSVWIGSDGTSPGTLDLIRAQIEFRGAGGGDELTLDDRAAMDSGGRPLRTGYALTPNRVGNNSGLGAAPRVFAGLTYDESLSRLELLGSAGSSRFHVTPSPDTEFHVVGHPDADPLDGNSLTLDETGVLGAVRQHLAHDAGTWSFAEPHRPIQFRDIASFHRVAFGASAGTTTIHQATTADATFVVTYRGLTALGLDDGLGEHDAVRVVGPNGYRELARFVSVTPSWDGSVLVATYRVPAPGGQWQSGDNGAYAIEILPDRIGNGLGRMLPAAQIGTLWVHIGSLWLTSTLQEPGTYRLDVAGSSPGATVVFVRGNQAGPYPLTPLGLTLDVADPVLLGEVVADASGLARLVVQVPPHVEDDLLGFQAFEQAPAPLASQLVQAATRPRLIESIETVGAAVTGGQSVQFRVTFALPVAGVNAKSFDLLASHHVANARISHVAGQGSVYLVTIETGSGDGTLGLYLNDEGMIANATGVAANQTRQGGFAGPSITIHKTREDVNLDFVVSPVDALVLINALNRNSGGYPVGGGDSDRWWHDVNGNGWVSPQDVLIIVNYLNFRAAQGEGESESEAAVMSDFRWPLDGVPPGRWERDERTAASGFGQPPESVSRLVEPRSDEPPATEWSLDWAVKPDPTGVGGEDLSVLFGEAFADVAADIDRAWRLRKTE